jgi:hypothetical protein
LCHANPRGRHKRTAPPRARAAAPLSDTPNGLGYLWKRRSRCRWLAMMCRLLIGIGKLEQ